MASSVVDNFSKNKFVYDDTVFKFNKNGRIKLGVVSETHDDEYSISDSEYEYGTELGEGEVNVMWYSRGVEQVVKERNVQLAYRPLSPGVVVRRINCGNNSPLGYCSKLITSADVQIKGTSHVIKDVSSTRLRCSISSHDSVWLDSWIGETKKIEKKVLLKTDCGAVVEILVTNNNIKLTDPDNKDRYPFFSQLLYPGQTLVGFKRSLENATWLSPEPSFRSTQKISFVVQSVQIHGIHVVWQFNTESIKSLSDKKDGVPSSYLTGDDIKRLKRLKQPFKLPKFYETNSLELSEGDIANLTSKAQWSKERFPHNKNQKILPNAKPFDVQSNSETSESSPMRKKPRFDSGIEKTDDNDGWETDDNDGWETDDNDGWEIDNNDGCKYSQLSHCLIPSPTLRSSSPKKLSMPLNKMKTLNKEPKVGDEVVVETILLYSKATVIWQDGSIESGISSTHLYPMEDDDQAYFPGNYVIADSENSDSAARTIGIVQTANNNECTAIVKWFRTPDNESSNFSELQFVNETEASVYDLKYHPNFIFEPSELVIRVANFEKDKVTVGYVLGTDIDGRVKVQWVDGHSSLCWPQEIVLCGRQSESDSEEDEKSFAEFNIEDLIDDVEMQLTNNLRDAIAAINNFEKSKLKQMDNEEVMQMFYKVNQKCSFIDSLMSTSFFGVEEIKTHLIDMGVEKNSSAESSCFGSNVSSTLETPTKSLIPTLPIITVDAPQRNPSNKSSEQRSIDEPTMPLSSCDETINCYFDVPSIELQSDNKLNENNQMANQQDIDKELNEKSQIASQKDLNQSHDSGNHSKTESGESSNNSMDPVTGIKLNDNDLVPKLALLLKNNFRRAMLEMSTRALVALRSVKDTDDKFTKDFPIEIETNEDEIDNSEDVSNVINPLLSESFVVLENAPISHKFESKKCDPSRSQEFHRAVKCDHKVLRTSLPPGVWVKAYEDRMDLLSVMVEGPKKTPYEDGLFLFDFQLSKDYPIKPPLCHYISFCSDRLNPNLYENGKVCVSLLGTWSGKGSEVWRPGCTLLQVIVSIQGLILVDEPFFNEPGYEKQRGTQQGLENSQNYNEVAVLRSVESMIKLMANPSEVFYNEILNHFRKRGDAIYQRLTDWMDTSNGKAPPEFPLVPVSRGFCLKLNRLLIQFRNQLDAINQQ